MTAPVLKEAGSKLTGAVPTMRMRPTLREMKDVYTTQEVGCAAYGPVLEWGFAGRGARGKRGAPDTDAAFSRVRPKADIDPVAYHGCVHLVAMCENSPVSLEWEHGRGYQSIGGSDGERDLPDRREIGIPPPIAGEAQVRENPVSDQRGLEGILAVWRRSACAALHKAANIICVI